jgi:hypothetical protein
MRRLNLIFIILTGLLFVACAQEKQKDTTKHNEQEQAAVQSAEKWLALVDQGKYAASWDEAAGIFKNAVLKDKWVETINGVRPPFGKVLLREVKTKTFKTSVPGAPDGEYVIIQFQTKFENKASAIETVTPVKEQDGVWRVSGYFIK